MSAPADTQELTMARSGQALQALTQQMGLADQQETYDILMQTIMPGNTSYAEVAAFAMVCSEFGLNPLLKQVHAFKSKQGGIQPMVGIDGWLKLARANADFNGMEWKEGREDDELWCECTVRLKSTPEYPVTIREYLSENKRDSEPWKKSPRRMLRHRATIQAIRYALGICGLADETDRETMEARDEQVRDVTPRQAATRPMASPMKSSPMRAVAARVVEAEPVVAGSPEDSSAVGTLQENSKVAPECNFETLLYDLRDAGKSWEPFKAWLEKKGVQLPPAGNAAKHDQLAAWIYSQAPLLSEMISEGWIIRGE